METEQQTAKTDPEPIIDEPSDQSQTPKPAVKKSKLIILVVTCAILLAGAAVVAWLFLRDAKTSNPPLSNSSQDYKLAPRFTEIGGYTSFDGAEWYGTNGGVIRIKEGSEPAYYTQREGVPVGWTAKVFAHNNQLWVSAQHGVATLKTDESGFEAVNLPDEIINGQLYRDSFDNKLYFSTFEKFYTYDDAAKTWKAEPTGSNSPKDLYSFTANDDYLVSTMNGLNMPVWVYSKKDAKWSLKKPAGMGDGVPTTAFTLDGQIFVMGRSPGYVSCEQSGEITATSAFRLDEGGQWQAVTGFNADKARPELYLARHVKDPATVFYTSPCEDQGPDIEKYKVSYKDNQLVLEKAGVISDGYASTAGDDGEQQTAVNEISKATGLYPFIRVLDVDKDGDLIFSYSTKADRSSVATPEGVAIAKGTNFAAATKLKISDDDKYNAQIPVMCDGELSYIVVGTYDLTASGFEGFANGKWSKASLLKVNGANTEAFAELPNEMGEPRFACTGGKISWTGKNAVQQLDLASKKITTVGSGLPDSNIFQSQSVQTLKNGDMWLLLSANAKKEGTESSLYYFTSASQNLKKVGTYKAVALLAATSTHAWLAESYDYTNSETFKGLAIYDTNGGKTFKDVEFLRLGLTGNNTALIAQAQQPGNSIFIPFKMISYTIGGSDTAVAPQLVPAATLRLGALPGESGGRTGNGGLLDEAHRRIWFSDDQLGSFAIDL